MPEQRKACGAVGARRTGRKALDCGLFPASRLVHEHAVGRERADEVRGEAVVRGLSRRAGRRARGRTCAGPSQSAWMTSCWTTRAPVTRSFSMLRSIVRQASRSFSTKVRARRAARERLEPHRPGAGEEIEHGRAVDGADQVEGGLADAVGGRPRVAALRREDPGPAVFAADDAHAMILAAQAGLQEGMSSSEEETEVAGIPKSLGAITMFVEDVPRAKAFYESVFERVRGLRGRQRRRLRVREHGRQPAQRAGRPRADRAGDRSATAAPPAASS